MQVVHVAPLTVLSAPLTGVAIPLDQRPLAEIRRDVERLVAGVPNPGVAVDIQVFEGDPPSFIRKLTERYQRAVIVMGSHGRKWHRAIRPGLGRPSASSAAPWRRP